MLVSSNANGLGFTNGTTSISNGATLHLGGLTQQQGTVNMNGGTLQNGFLTNTALVGASGNNTTTGKISQQLERVSLLPEWMYESYMSGRAKTERGAWAYALKQSRKLEKGGYNVLAGFENVADVKEYINCSLLSYELARLQTLMKKKGDAALENYQPRFIHQSPKKNVI
jgi:hypothetical protein